MPSENILKFKNFIYNRMKSENLVYSAYKLYSEYIRHYGFDHTKEEIFDFFIKDNRFLLINETQILLKEIVDKLIAEDFHGKETKYIIDYIKQKYFISSIDETIITEIVNKYRKDNKIVLEYDLSYYEVRNKGDFDKVIIREGKISYLALEEVATFLEIGVPELMMELSSKNIFMDETVGMKYKIFKAHNIERISNHDYSEDKFKLRDLSKITAYNSDCETSQYQYEFLGDSNILSNNLYTHEIISNLIALVSQGDRLKIDITRFYPGHINTLRKLNIVKCTDDSNYSITKIGSELLEDFTCAINKYINYKIELLVDRYYSTRELSMSNEVKTIDSKEEIWTEISNTMKKIYGSNYYVNKLMKLISLTNKEHGKSMKDIFFIALENNMHNELIEILIGDKASNGIKPIINQKDICMTCNRDECKLGRDKNSITKKLMYYRQHYVDNFIAGVKQSSAALNLIKEDPLMIKFLVPCNLTSKNKVIMKKIGLIKESKVLYKKDGGYCPERDIWIMEE